MKLDSLCSMVQHHSDSFEILHKTQEESFEALRSSMASKQNILAKMMIKLQNLDKSASPSPQPSLLPLPSPPRRHPHHPHLILSSPSFHSNSSSPSTSPPKIIVPVFSGKAVMGWLSQIYHYFVFNQILHCQCLEIVTFYMAGHTLQWFH